MFCRGVEILGEAVVDLETPLFFLEYVGGVEDTEMARGGFEGKPDLPRDASHGGLISLLQILKN